MAEPIPETSEQPRVLITEVIIEGIDGHPEQERLELAAYDAMAVRPGSRVTRDELKLDLDAIYSTGWFSDVRIEPINGPLGVQLVVQVMPNPVLTQVVLEPEDNYIEPQVIEDTFSADYGRTLNLSELQLRMKELQKWYADQGYSLARVSGPTRVSPDGVVELKVLMGTVAGVEVKFVNKEGDDTNEKGEPLKGKTKPWVVSREISLKPGEPFNRTQLEGDIRRLYATSLFSDVKVTLKPVTGEPGAITIVLGIVEQSTGSLSGGLGYSQSQGVFGQVQLSDSNLFGRAWNLALNITYGQFGGLANLTFSDPWIKVIRTAPPSAPRCSSAAKCRRCSRARTTATSAPWRPMQTTAPRTPIRSTPTTTQRTASSTTSRRPAMNSPTSAGLTTKAIPWPSSGSAAM